MLSIMNEIDPCLSRPLCVLYGIQNQIFLQLQPTSKTGLCLRIRKSLTGSDVGLCGIGFPKMGNYIRGHIQDLTCCAYILRQLKCLQNNCTKGYVEAIREVGRWHTEPSLKDIGGQACTNKRWNSLKSVISAKGLLLASINLGDFLTPYLAHGLSRSGGQIQ